MAVVNTRPQAVLSHCKGDTSEPVVEHAIGDALRLAAQKWGGRIALVDGSPPANSRHRWTFEQLLEDAEQVAPALLGRFAPGDHVAIWSPNCPEWVLLNRPGCPNLRRHHRPGHRCLTGCPNQTRGARPNNLTVPCEPTHKTTWRFPLWI